MTEENKLLPCPFCGASAKPWQQNSMIWAVMCSECGAEYDASEGLTEAVAAWNRRVPDARDARIAELEAARIAYASEFPVNADGDPDVGNIHANIRALKAELAAAKAPAPIPPNSTELEPSTPWYPDDSGEWVEVPEDLVGRPAALPPETRIEVLLHDDRKEHAYKACTAMAKNWMWAISPGMGGRIVAYKVVKP